MNETMEWDSCLYGFVIADDFFESLVLIYKVNTPSSFSIFKSLNWLNETTL